jgi:hypothetical protein
MFPISDANPTGVSHSNLCLIAINILGFSGNSPVTRTAGRLYESTVVPANISNNLFSLETIFDIVHSVFFMAAGIISQQYVNLSVWRYVEDRPARLAFNSLFCQWFCGSR